MNLNKKQIQIFEYLAYLFTFVLFLLFFGKTLNYGRTYDDFMLVDKFIKSPGDAKLISSFLYAKFHFYPIYFLTHELDNFITFLLNFNGIEILNAKVAKFTNIFLHVTNSFLVYLFLKKIFNINTNLRENILIFFGSLSFLFHPITSQTIFNITTRNESLALFFGLLTFIYCLDHFKNKRFVNYFFIALLYFFALCSKLTVVYLAGLIPLSVFLLKYNEINLRENIKNSLKIFLTLILIFFVYYFLRNIFTEDNQLYFYRNISDFLFYFFTTIKFYLIGLFFPYEHIYVYADNYNINSSIIIFILFLIFSIYSVLIFISKKDHTLMISTLWICASLTLPVLFGVIETGFPLISNLAERYQYSSVVGISIIITWILLKFPIKLYHQTFVLSSHLLLIIFFVVILIDRSKVYINNSVFMGQSDESSPKNTHRYAFSTLMTDAINVNDISKYKFNLYQYYQLDPSFEEVILEFLRFYIYEKNKKGEKYFENEHQKYFSNNPPKQFTLAKFYSLHGKFDKAEDQIKNIFKKYKEVKLNLIKQNKQVRFIDPAIDDLYFELGKINFNLEKYEEALLNFKEANLVNPKHATALFNAAITLKKLGLNQEALQFYKDAIKINPFLRETANNLVIEAQNYEK